MFDIAVVGAGIAGASVAAELAGTASVILLEQESQPGYHTTGRSAAVFIESYGPAPIRALTRASLGFFTDPPPGFSQTPLVSPRGMVMVARREQLGALEELMEELDHDPAIKRLNQSALHDLVPLLRSDYGVAGTYDDRALDIDVHGLHQGYLRQFKTRGGVLKTNACVGKINHSGGCWHLETPERTVEADIVVNAAGAWADEIGQRAGAVKIDLVPKRRTAVIVDAPPGAETDNLPLVADVDEQFYLRPDAGRLLISPADETPSPPCDIQPDEMDIAVCVDRIETAFDLNVRKINNKWAGLRSFVADKSPVVSFDPNTERFFWLAGQGGYGIQSAPALARLAAAMVLGNAIPNDIIDQGFDAQDVSPTRFNR